MFGPTAAVRFAFSTSTTKRVGRTVLYCARPASTFRACALREHEGQSGQPSIPDPFGGRALREHRTDRGVVPHPLFHKKRLRILPGRSGHG